MHYKNRNTVYQLRLGLENNRISIKDDNFPFNDLHVFSKFDPRLFQLSLRGCVLKVRKQIFVIERKFFCQWSNSHWYSHSLSSVNVPMLQRIALFIFIFLLFQLEIFQAIGQLCLIVNLSCRLYLFFMQKYNFP